MFLTQVMFNKHGSDFEIHPYSLHCRIQMAFPKPERIKNDPDNFEAFSKEFFGSCGTDQKRTSEANYLYMIRGNGRGYTLTVQSPQLPSFDYALKGLEHLLVSKPQTKYREIEYENGEKYRFTLRANPTSGFVNKEGKGRLRRVLDAGSACNWIKKQLFECCDIQYIKEINRGSYKVRKKVKKNSQEIYGEHQIVIADYDGCLVVKNSEKMRDAVISGIGRSKYLGCGLMLVF